MLAFHENKCILDCYLLMVGVETRRVVVSYIPYVFMCSYLHPNVCQPAI